MLGGKVGLEDRKASDVNIYLIISNITHIVWQKAEGILGEVRAGCLSKHTTLC